MATRIPDSLERLSPSDLIGVVGDLIGEVGRLRAENEKLGDALRKLKAEHQAIDRDARCASSGRTKFQSFSDHGAIAGRIRFWRMDQRHGLLPESLDRTRGNLTSAFAQA